MSASDRDTKGRLLLAAAAVLVLTGLGLSACGPFDRSGPPGPSASSTGTTTPSTMSPLPYSAPQHLKVPSIGVDAPIVPEGLDAQGRLVTPPINESNLVGWYRGGPAPGQDGPAVLEGHVDSKSGPSVFYKLGRLPRNAAIEVIRGDGAQVIFRADSIEQVSKDAFPTQKVYGHLDYPALRLITCGGTFNRSAGHYEDNIIVYAHRSPA
jgi:sortase (surface protein transpeptidase)